ncbi:subtilisin-like protease SBT5.3 [Phragmites australis]|uniref:subtilisin-like protease SBT5.3 n=1 Tax=Phragmites australis TaxID=29695 RepID=UPI002D79C5B5|nr:subtilisin-like protease SBT5.3 [Phragmites australis]
MYFTPSALSSAHHALSSPLSHAPTSRNAGSPDSSRGQSMEVQALTGLWLQTCNILHSYVVYLGGHSHGREGAALASSQERARSSHHALLGAVLRSEERARDAIFYSYTRYINGFAATLEEDEAAEISKHPSVVSVFPNRGHRLHTTRSWEFLGMEKDGRVRASSIWAKARFGEGIIIGNLDTGTLPLT